MATVEEDRVQVGDESTTPPNFTPSTTTSCTVGGPSNGTTYYFTVKAVNASGTSAASNQASVVAGAPLAVANQYSTTIDGTSTVSAANGVLANDTLNGATIVSHTNPAHSTLTLNANGSFTYSPSFLFFDTDSFTYELQNADGSSVATVTIQINP